MSDAVPTLSCAFFLPCLLSGSLCAMLRVAMMGCWVTERCVQRVLDCFCCETDCCSVFSSCLLSMHCVCHILNTSFSRNFTDGCHMFYRLLTRGNRHRRKWSKKKRVQNLGGTEHAAVFVCAYVAHHA